VLEGPGESFDHLRDGHSLAAMSSSRTRTRAKPAEDQSDPVSIAAAPLAGPSA
jgi:hypothetical protein